MLSQFQSFKVAALLVLILGWTAGVFWLGGEHARKQAAEDKLDTALHMLESQAESAKKLQDTIDKLPKSENKVREIVRDNPSPCERPKPVSDGLSEAIREANAARKVSGNSR